MRNWKALGDEIRSLQSVPLDYSGQIPQAHLNAFKRHSAFVLNHLLSCIDNADANDDEKEIALYQLVRMRGKIIPRKSIDYFLHTDLPDNLACIAVAKFLLKPEESLIGILFPEVSKIIGVVPIGDAEPDGTYPLIKYVSNEEFSQHNYIRLTSGEIADIFAVADSAREVVDRFFPIGPDDQKPDFTFHISAEDRALFRKVTGKPSQNYFDTLADIHRVEHGDGYNIYAELKKLWQALLTSSVDPSGVGSETTADVFSCAEPIIEFHQHWIALSEDILDGVKNAEGKRVGGIKEYTANGSSFSLQSHLLPLFAPVIGVTQAERDRIEHDVQRGFVMCTKQIGTQLQSIAAAHRDLLDIPLAGHKDAVKAVHMPTKEVLTSLHLDLLPSLSAPRKLCGYDENCVQELALFEVIATEFCQPLSRSSLAVRLSVLEDKFNTLYDLSLILKLLSTQYWPHFFRFSERKIVDILQTYIKGMKERRDAAAGDEAAEHRLFRAGFLDGHPIAYLLQALPLRSWSSLITIASQFSEIERFFLLAGEINTILIELPEMRWPCFREALIAAYPDHLFATGDSIGLFWNASEYRREVNFALFQKLIYKTLEDKNEVLCMLMVTPPDQWRALLQTVAPAIEKKVHNHAWLKFILSSLSLEQNIFLITAIKHVFVDWTVKTLPDLVAILRNLNCKDWRTVFGLFANELCREKIKTGEVLLDFLGSFQSGDARVVIAECLLSARVPISRCDSVLLEKVLRDYPECSASVLFLLLSSLQPALQEFLTDFQLHEKRKIPVHPKIKTSFYFLVEKILPEVLKTDRLVLFSSLDRVKNVFETQSLVSGFQSIEYALKEGACDSGRACLQKLVLLETFFSKIEKKQPVQQKQKTFEYVMELSFIESIFPGVSKDFVSSMLRHLKQRYETIFDMDGVRNTVQTQTVENQPFELSYPQANAVAPLPSINLAARSRMFYQIHSPIATPTFIDTSLPAVDVRPRVRPRVDVFAQPLAAAVFDEAEFNDTPPASPGW